MRLRCDLFKGV